MRILLPETRTLTLQLHHFSANLVLTGNLRRN